MNRIWITALFLFTLLGCAPVEYSAQDLAQRGAKQVEGVVTKQSRGSFVLKDTAGEEKIFRTGELTQYMPPDYRSLDGDTVRVTYEESFQDSGKLKRSVLQLAPMHIPDKNKQWPNPIRGEIIRVGKGSVQHSNSLLMQLPGQQDATPIYIPFDKVLIEINGKPGALPAEVTGKRAEITARRIPIYRGNGYLYEAEKITITDNQPVQLR
jgi:hypothetical protein